MVLTIFKAYLNKGTNFVLGVVNNKYNRYFDFFLLTKNANVKMITTF